MNLPVSRKAVKRLLGTEGWELRDRRLPWNGPPLFPASIRWEDIETKEFRVEGIPSWSIRLAIQGDRVTGLAVTQYRHIDSRLWAVGSWCHPAFVPGHAELSAGSTFGAMPVIIR